jgi:hypothetical protein
MHYSHRAQERLDVKVVLGASMAGEGAVALPDQADDNDDDDLLAAAAAAVDAEARRPKQAAPSAQGSRRKFGGLLSRGGSRQPSARVEDAEAQAATSPAQKARSLPAILSLAQTMQHSTVSILAASEPGQNMQHFTACLPISVSRVALKS